MSGPTSNVQWYLARDGQQFGPISEAEMAKFLELGHLQPTDLLWREGFPDWRPAMVVFPPRGQALPPGPRLTRPDAGRGHATEEPMGEPHAGRRPADRGGSGEADGGRRRSRLGRALALLAIAAILAGAGTAAYLYRAQLAAMVASLSAAVRSYTTTSPPSEALAIDDRKSLETPPLAGLANPSAKAIDITLQATALWRVVKREFPDWYQGRIEEAAALARDSKDGTVIAQMMARKLAELRRKHVADGLSATREKLMAVARAYRDTLGRLRSDNAEACKGFIRQGEASPLIVGLLQGSAHTAHLQAELTAVFEAIADGRQLPRVHPRPNLDQHAMLTDELSKRGWTSADSELLSSSQAMAEAPPEKLCQVVHDFFTAQLSVSDPEAQFRLIVNSLRPVFAG